MAIIKSFGQLKSKWHELGNSPNSLNYFRSTFVLFLDKGVKLLAEMAVGFYLARYLGAQQFGLYNFAISFVILFQGISTFGLAEILTREMVNAPDQNNRILGTAFIFRLIGATILTIIIFSIAYFFYDRSVAILVGIISLSLIFRSAEVLTYYFQSVVKLELVAMVQIMATVIFSIVKLVLISHGATLIAFAIVYSIEWGLILVGLLFILRPYIKLSTLSFSLSWNFRLLRGSWYLMVSAMAVNLYMRMDQVMIKNMLGDQDNGIYAAAVRISEVWYVVPTILCSVFFSAILSARNISKELYESRYIKLNSILFWIAVIIGIAISPFGTDLIVLLYGEPFREAGRVLTLHIWTAPFVFWGVCSGYWLISEDLQSYSLVRTLFGLFVNLIFNLILIPKYGVWGASLATLFGQIAASSISMLIFNKTRHSFHLQVRSIVYPIKYIYSFLGKLFP